MQEPENYPRPVSLVYTLMPFCPPQNVVDNRGNTLDSCLMLTCTSRPQARLVSLGVKWQLQELASSSAALHPPSCGLFPQIL